MLKRFCSIFFAGSLVLAPGWVKGASIQGAGNSGAGSKQAASGQKASDNNAGTPGDSATSTFNEGAFAQANALAYRAMQETAAIIARSSPGVNGTYVFFDAPAFAAINEARFRGAQINVLTRGLCDAAAALSPKKRERDFQAHEFGLASPANPLDLVGSAADTLQKILQMMQTETTITGGTVNVSDAALVAEVAKQLGKNRQVYYPGQFLLAHFDENKLRQLLSSEIDPCTPQESIAMNMVALALEQSRAQQVYDLLPDSVKPKKAVAGAPDPLPTDAATASKAAILRNYLDSASALTKAMAAPDSTGQTPLPRLVLGEELGKLVSGNNTWVVVAKWLGAGAINKTRKNLFFLGSRNYYGAGATALFEYYASDQQLKASGTVTATARYVHDTDFEHGRFNGTVRCLSRSSKNFGAEDAEEFGCSANSPQVATNTPAGVAIASAK